MARKQLGATPSNATDVVTKDFVETSTATLTNKTLTTPKIGAINDTNGNKVIETVGRTSAVNYLQFANNAAASSPEISAVGSDANLNVVVNPKGTGSLRVTGGQITPGTNNVSLNLVTLGTGVVQANSVEVVTTSGTQGLSNKTLASPKVSTLLDVNGNTILTLAAQTSAVNYLTVLNGTGYPSLTPNGTSTDIGIWLAPKNAGLVGIYMQAGLSTATLQAGGVDADVSLNLVSKGAGTVKANGVALVTVSNTVTITNKTLTSPTLTTPKIDSINDTTNGTTAIQIYSPASAVNYLQIRGNTAGMAPVLTAMGSDSNVGIQLVPKAAGAVAIWVGTGQTPTISASGADTNHNLNLQSKGTGVVQLNGVAAVDVSSAQTLTNKVLTYPKTDLIKDVNGANSLYLSPTVSAVNYIQVGNAAAGASPSLACVGTDANLSFYLVPKGAGRVAISVETGQTASVGATGVDANVNLNLVSKGTGVVQLNSVAAVDVSTTQTLTNKTITSGKFNTLYDTNNAAALSINATTSAVNYCEIRSAITGAGAQYRVAGTDSNIDLMLVPKGTAPVTIYAVSGVTPTLAAVGGDVNHNLNLVSKGTGVVTANGVALVTISGTQTLTGKTIAAGSNTITGIGVTQLGGITGTPSASTVLRGDGTWATVNSSDATLLARANHTGTQTASTISDFSTAADARVTAGITGKENTITAGTTGQYYRGDKSWQTLNAAAVGITVPSGTIVGTTDTQTLTNKRVTARVGTTASSATPTINTDTYDQYTITALAAAITSWTISGTPTDGQKLMIRIKDNGSARALAWPASFMSGPALLPTETVATMTHLIGLIYDSAKTMWVCAAADPVGY